MVDLKTRFFYQPTLATLELKKYEDTDYVLSSKLKPLYTAFLHSTCKRDYSWNPSICICENSKYLKSIADTSLIECDEIITVMDIASTKKTNKMLQ